MYITFSYFRTIFLQYVHIPHPFPQNASIFHVLIIPQKKNPTSIHQFFTGNHRRSRARQISEIRFSSPSSHRLLTILRIIILGAARLVPPLSTSSSLSSSPLSARAPAMRGLTPRADRKRPRQITPLNEG